MSTMSDCQNDGFQLLLGNVRLGFLNKKLIDKLDSHHTKRQAVKTKTLGRIEVNLVYIPTLLKREKLLIP